MEQFYTNAGILLTGVTEYVGKSILKKLLRSCPQVHKIFVFIRGKRNQCGDERLRNILQAKLFDRVRCSEKSQDLFAKVVVIDGDITLDGLGITLGNAEILKSNVSIVFHVTANVNFNSGLKNLVKANTEGTHNVLKCSKQFHRLKAFVYVSTAFSNSYLEEIEERIYPPTLDPHFVMLLCSELQPDLINLLTEKLMYKHKTCYTFFKHLAESLIHEARFDYPVCFVRPTIVGPAHLEPYPGWVDNFTGMCGYMAGMSQGIVRCMYSNRQGTVEIVPVDHVVNVTLTAAMNVSSKIFQIQNDVIVYNCSNTEHPFAYKQFQPSLLEACEKYPFNETFWRPLLVIVRNKIMFSILNFLLQYIPAVVVDGVAMLMEKKPRMLKIYGKVQALTDAVREIQRTDFRFRTDNMKVLYNCIEWTDQKCFDFRIENAIVKDYFRNCFYGLKFYAGQE